MKADKEGETRWLREKTEDFTILYFTALIVTGCLFLGRFRVKKPGKKMLTLLLIIGVIEFVLFLILHMIPHLIQP